MHRSSARRRPNSPLACECRAPVLGLLLQAHGCANAGEVLGSVGSVPVAFGSVDRFGSIEIP
eukprot:10485453-Alexandrium_andersonii.AAC.1